MPSFSKRSYEKELLDRDDIPFSDIKRNMQELDFINTWLGGHKISCDGIRNIILKRKEQLQQKNLLICEIGSGGGNNLFAIDKWCRKNSINADYIGIDINQNCVEATPAGILKNLKLVVSDYSSVEFEKKPDIIFSSLFCHHFSDEQLVSQLKWMDANSSWGFFINDLHRHPLAYYSIKTLTRLFSRSYLVKNDAPLSVRRGFNRKEWQTLLEKAGLRSYKIEWKWAFRWLITKS